MKVLVLGATGLGRLIVRDALAKGHSFVASFQFFPCFPPFVG